MLIIVGNKIVYLGSNPGWVCVSPYPNALGKGMNALVLLPTMNKW